LEAQNFLGTKYDLPKNALGGYDLASKPPKLVDQSSPNFFAERGSNRGRSNTWFIWNIFICFGDIRRRALSLAKFCMFWPLILFFTEGP